MMSICYAQAEGKGGDTIAPTSWGEKMRLIQAEGHD